jgi:hypothetical protein
VSRQILIFTANIKIGGPNSLWLLKFSGVCSLILVDQTVLIKFSEVFLNLFDSFGVNQML